MEINFRKVKKHDIFYRVKWLNDRVVTRFLRDRIYKKTNIQGQTKWFRENKKSF